MFPCDHFLLGSKKKDQKIKSKTPQREVKRNTFRTREKLVKMMEWMMGPPKADWASFSFEWESNFRIALKLTLIP
jgi:hypothetical protein